MEVFWREGYQGASLSTLGPAMGLRPGSIYAAFGSKEALYREALAVYTARVRDTLGRADVPARQILERWFASFIAAALDVEGGQLGRGCLLLGSAAEAPRLDPQSAALVRAELDALERFFKHCVKQARAAAPAEARNQADRPSPAATARLLVAALAGISAMSRAGVTKRALDDVARAALAQV